MSETNKSFKNWCIVELFGHSKIAGLCTEENLFGTNMLRVDVPVTSEQPAFTKYYGGAAIYAINPVDEKTATICAENLKTGQVQEWNAESFIKKFNENKLGLPAPDNDGIFDLEIEGDDDRDYHTTAKSEGGVN